MFFSQFLELNFIFVNTFNLNIQRYLFTFVFLFLFFFKRVKVSQLLEMDALSRYVCQGGKIWNYFTKSKKKTIKGLPNRTASFHPNEHTYVELLRVSYFMIFHDFHSNQIYVSSCNKNNLMNYDKQLNFICSN